MDYQEILLFESTICIDILKHFDIAVKIEWSNSDHRRIFSYLKSLTMYTRIKTFSHFGHYGTFFAFRFNERENLEDSIHKISKLIENESLLFAKKEINNGCHIFTLK